MSKETGSAIIISQSQVDIDATCHFRGFNYDIAESKIFIEYKIC